MAQARQFRAAKAHEGQLRPKLPIVIDASTPRQHRAGINTEFTDTGVMTIDLSGSTDLAESAAGVRIARTSRR